MSVHMCAPLPLLPSSGREGSFRGVSCDVLRDDIFVGESKGCYSKDGENSPVLCALMGVGTLL